MTLYYITITGVNRKLPQPQIATRLPPPEEGGLRSGGSGAPGKDRRRETLAPRSYSDGHEDSAGGAPAPGGIAGESRLVILLERAAATGRAYRPPAAGHSETLEIFAWHCLLAGLVWAERIKQWTFCKRDETIIRKVKQMAGERVWGGSTSVPKKCHRQERKVLERMNPAGYRRRIR